MSQSQDDTQKVRGYLRGELIGALTQVDLS
jgi:hypothetical protein